MNRTLKLFGRFFVFAIAITIFSFSIFTFSSTQVYAEGSFVFTNHLELGVVSNDVLELQTLLNAKGYNVGIPDGKFGTTTKEQVILFQKANGLTPDGIVGQGVRAFLNGTSASTTPTPKNTTTPKIITTTPPATTSTSLNRTLKLSMTGDDVKALQTFLNNLGYNVGIADGSFGPKTQSAVKLFQTANNLTPDGSVGPATRGIMNSSPTSNFINNQTSISGCTSSLGFSTTTGKSCANISVSTLGCTSGALFNTITGASCQTLSVLPAGCSSTSLFSTTSGVSCTTGLPATPILKLSGGGSSGPSIQKVSPTITGVTIPAQGGTPVSTLSDTTQYSAVIAWTGSPSVFAASTSYTATITLTAKSGYTLSGVTANYFTVAGATSTNLVDSGIITAVFPATPLIQLTISNPTLTTSKAYNGNTTAVVTAGTLSGIIGSETVTVSATATYDNKNIGTGKTITVVYTLGGADAGHYIKPADYTVATGVITIIPLTISNPTLTTSKEYDRTTGAVVTAGSLVSVVGGDDVSVTALATYDSPSVNTGKMITVVYTLAGSDAGNYVKPVDRVVYTGIISQKQLTISAPTLTTTKTYNQSNSAVVSAGTLSGIVGTEDVSISSTTATYDNANAGSGKTITVAYTITGADSANYIKPVNYTTATGVINTIQLTISLPTLTLSKSYNSNTTAVVTAGTLSGILAGDTVTVTALANYADTNVGTNKTITTVYTLGGAQAGNYIKPVDYVVSTGAITATNIQLTISAPTLTTSKIYDSNTSAVVTAGTLIGKVPSDTVTVSAVATYDTKQVGTGKTITVVYTLGGADASKYIKPVDYVVNTGIITAVQLTISNPTLTTSKEYDRTTNAVVTAGSLTGVIDGGVTASASANYDSVNIGTNKTITTTYYLSGANAGNYIKPVDYVVYSGIITTKQLTINTPTLTVSKLYDRNTTAVVTANALIGVASGEDVTVSSAVATYDTANVGTGKTITVVYTITGASIANYIKPVNYTTSSGIITAVQLTVSAPTLTTTKVYTGTTTAVVTAGSLSGIIAGDTVTVSAVANYADANVGTGKTITTVYTLGGASLANYTKPVNDINNTGVITAIGINTAAISGVTVPVVGATPVATLADGTGYTATISWSGAPVTFAPLTVYTATITLTAKTGYTLTGVTTNFFTVAGTSTPATNSADSGVVTAVFPATAQLPATTPSSITLAVGSTAPVGGVTNVAIPAAGGTDTTGVITGYVATTADKIKFTVVDGGSATSSITINGGAYTSGADYQIVPTSSLPTVVVTTSEASRSTVTRTFVITGPILGADGLTYGIVMGADGKKWLDRNLGATRVATSFDDYQSYGNLYQWGRGADGHQLITHTTATAATPVNGNTSTLATSDTPGDNLFIKQPSSPYDWRNPANNNLWQGVNGTNNVCPAGFRLPTNTEQGALVTAAGITNSATAYSSSLKLTAAGARYYSDASLYNLGVYGYYWSSSVSGTNALFLYFNASSVYPAGVGSRANGFTVRCLKD